MDFTRRFLNINRHFIEIVNIQMRFFFSYVFTISLNGLFPIYYFFNVSLVIRKFSKQSICINIA